MTVLAAIQGAAAVIGIEVPTAVYSEVDREMVELQHLCNEMATRIYKEHDWELLKTLETITGDGSTLTWSLPSDYGRQVKDMNLWSSRIETPLTHIVSTDKWLELDVQAYQYVIGVWQKIGGVISIKPATLSTETVKYYYISNLIVSPSGAGSDKVAFTDDTDTFRLDERLLKLGMIWQWRANKGLPYGEDMENYENALGQLINEDKGSRILVVGARRRIRGVNVSYPESIAG